MHIRRTLFLFLGFVVALAPLGLAERIYPPFITADVRSSSRGQGISGGTAYPSGCMLLYARVVEGTDHAMATAKLGTTITVQTDSRVEVWIRLSHTSGSAGLTWFGQMSDVTAKPYYGPQYDATSPGMRHRLSGAPLADTATQYLEALALLRRENSAALSPTAWAAANAFQQAQDDEERTQAWTTILQEGTREGCLQFLLDAMDRLGHLRHEEVRLLFTADADEVSYNVGLEVEVAASPLRPGQELSWFFGRIDWIQVIQD